MCRCAIQFLKRTMEYINAENLVDDNKDKFDSFVSFYCIESMTFFFYNLELNSSFTVIL